MEEEYKEYKHLLEEMPDLFAVMQDDRIVFTNSWTAERYGYSKDELIGKPVMAMIAPEERERVLRIIHQDKLTELETLNNYQTIFLTKYGTKIPVEVTSWITQYRGRPAAAEVFRPSVWQGRPCL